MLRAVGTNCLCPRQPGSSRGPEYSPQPRPREATERCSPWLLMAPRAPRALPTNYSSQHAAQRSAARPASLRPYYTSRRAPAPARHAGTAHSTWCAARGRGGARGLRRPFAAARAGAAPRARPGPAAEPLLAWGEGRDGGREEAPGAAARSEGSSPAAGCSAGRRGGLLLLLFLLLLLLLLPPPGVCGGAGRGCRGRRRRRIAAGAQDGLWLQGEADRGARAGGGPLRVRGLQGGQGHLRTRLQSQAQGRVSERASGAGPWPARALLSPAAFCPTGSAASPPLPALVPSFLRPRLIPPAEPRASPAGRRLVPPGWLRASPAPRRCAGVVFR